MNNETWKQIPREGFEHYQISSNGKVKNTLRNKLLKQSFNDWGYLKVTLINNKTKKRKGFYVHREMMQTFNPINNPDDLTVHHKDGNKYNNALENLEWQTWKNHTILEASNNTIRTNIKEKIGKFSKDGILISICKGAQQSSTIHKASHSLEPKGEFYYRRFPKTETPQVGKMYDLYDSMFHTYYYKTRNTQDEKKNYQMFLGI